METEDAAILNPPKAGTASVTVVLGIPGRTYEPPAFQLDYRDGD